MTANETFTFVSSLLCQFNIIWIGSLNPYSSAFSLLLRGGVGTLRQTRNLWCGASCTICTWDAGFHSYIEIEQQSKYRTYLEIWTKHFVIFLDLVGKRDAIPQLTRFSPTIVGFSRHDWRLGFSEDRYNGEKRQSCKIVGLEWNLFGLIISHNPCLHVYNYKLKNTIMYKVIMMQ